MTHYDHNMTPYHKKATHFDYTILRPNPKSLTEGKNTLWYKVDSGIGLPLVNVLESTLASTYGGVIVNYGTCRVTYTRFFFGFGLSTAPAQ
jgi:hypothetical protein